jgi:uncharacterized membrane protein (UPF0127 family)
VTLHVVLVDVGLLFSIVLGMAAFLRLRLRGLGASAEPGAARHQGLRVDGLERCRVEVAEDRRTRVRGLLGRDGIEGAMLFPRDAGVHTLRMRFPIDVAFLDKECRVVDVAMMRPGRIGRPRLKARSVLEAAAGSFATWGVKVGSHIEIIESGWVR